MNIKKITKGNKIILMILSVLLLSSVLTISLKAEVEAVPVASGDIASSTVARYPITYGSTTGTTIYDGYGRYSFQTFGNSNTVGYDDWKAGMVANPTIYIDEDTDSTTFSSTSMDFQQNGKIVKAYLYLSESHYLSGVDPTRDNTYILGPNGDKFYFDDGFQDAIYDITDFVTSQGSGTYWGKNIESERNYQASRDNFANWEIVIIEEDSTLPYKQLKLNGYNILMQNKTLLLNASNDNIALPNTGNLGGEVLLTSAGGNASLFSGTSYINSLLDGQVIQHSAIPSGVRGADLFQGRITKDGVDVLTRNPNRIPTNIDLLTQTLDENLIDETANNLQFQITTGTDMMWLHMVGISADIGVPNISVATYIENQGNIDKKFQIGDSIIINNTLTPDPNETKFFLANPIVSIQLPVNTEYVSNSVNIVGNQISKEEYDAQTGVLKFYLIDPIQTQAIDLAYQLQSKNGLKVSNIQTSLQGNNQVLTDLTDMDLSYVSNEVTLLPSYPVAVNHINERTGRTLLEESLTGLYNDTFTATTSNFTGLTFNSNANNSLMTGTFTDSSQTINLYYSPNIYVLAFDLNNGTSALPDSQDLAFDTLANKPADPTRQGYIFQGWNTEKNGSGQTWVFETNTMPADDVTLYAQWAKNDLPVTGDSSNAILFSSLLVLTGATLIFIKKRSFLK